MNSPAKKPTNGKAKKAKAAPQATPAPKASLRDTLERSMAGGPGLAFGLLGHLPNPDPRLDKLLVLYRQLSSTEMDSCSIEGLCAEAGVATWEFLGWVVMASGYCGGHETQLIINSAKPLITRASLDRALTDESVAKPWLQGWGLQPVPQRSQIIVNANASAQSVAAASAAERGLPSFVETTEEAEEALRALPESTAETIEVPFTVVEKEKVHADSQP